MLSLLRAARERLQGGARPEQASTDRTGHDAGFTLVDALVAMALSTILGAMALTWFLGASSSATTSTNTDIANANARNAAQSWGQLLTVAHSPVNDPATNPIPQLVSLTPTTITFNANVGSLGALPSCSTSQCDAGTPTPITLSARPVDAAGADGFQLVQQIGPSAPANVVVPAGVTEPTTSSCLFTAYTTAVSATGASVVTSLGCGTATAPLNADTLAGVTRVDLNFTVITGGHSRTYQTSAVLTGAEPSGGQQ